MGKKRNAKSARTESVAVTGDEDNLERYPSENEDLGELWFTAPLEENERSRVQRQMRARRELERRRDEKRLKELVDDWYFEDRP